MSKLLKTLCPCGSPTNYSQCCGLYIQPAGKNAPTPEALMRSRYTAYTLAKVGYIAKTMKGKPLQGFSKVEARKWAKQVSWLGLQVIKVSPVVFNTGYVEFIASFVEKGELNTIHEESKFIFEQNTWFYVGEK